MFGRKSSYWQHVNPVAAISDFKEVVRQAGDNKWRIGLAAAATTLFLFWSLTHESWRVPQEKPKIIYINSWYKDRAEGQTREFIEKNQKLKDALKADQDKRDEAVKQIYRTIGKASGMDTDAIEKKAKEEAEAEARREQARQVAPVAK
jgi:hypothetical protein